MQNHNYSMQTKFINGFPFEEYKKEIFSVQMNRQEGDWFLNLIGKISIENSKLHSFLQIKEDYEQKGLEDFELFWHSKPLKTLKSFGLLVL